MSSDNLRNLISSIREIQDLGELVSGRNVFNININYYENYNNAEPLDCNVSDEQLNSPVSNEGNEQSDEEYSNEEDSESIITESQDETSSSMSVEIQSNNERPDLSNSSGLYSCPIGHILVRIPRTSTQLNRHCSICNSIVNNYDFYRCNICNYYSCHNCILLQRNIPSINNYTPNISNYSPNISNYNPNRYSSTPISNQTVTYTDAESISNLTGLNNLTEMISTGLTNSIVDHITNQVTTSPDTIYVSVSNLTGDETNNPVSLSNLLSKSAIQIYQSIENPELKCHICNEDYNNNDICRKLNDCGHYYHSNCIDNWFVSNNNCPICNITI